MSNPVRSEDYDIGVVYYGVEPLSTPPPPLVRPPVYPEWRVLRDDPFVKFLLASLLFTVAVVVILLFVWS